MVLATDRVDLKSRECKLEIRTSSVRHFNDDLVEALKLVSSRVPIQHDSSPRRGGGGTAAP